MQRSSIRRSPGYYGNLTSIPPRLWKAAQKALHDRDFEADIIFRLPPEATYRRSIKSSAINLRAASSTIKRTYQIEDPIYYCLIDSQKIQARAFLLAGGVRCIAVYMGALILNQGSLNRLAVMPTLANYFGIEPHADAVLGSSPGDDTFTAFGRLLKPAPFKAKTEHERAVAESLIALLTNFIHLHELAHVVNGHLFALPNNAAMIAEDLADSTLLDEDTATRHVLEWDADAFAAVRLFAVVLGVEMPVERYYTFASELDRLRFRLVNALIAVYFACRLFQNEPFDSNKEMPAGHPPGAVRLLLMLPQARHAWQQVQATKDTPFPGDTLTVAAHLCESAIEELTSAPRTQFDLVSALPVSWVERYQRKLFHRFKELRPTLLAHKVGSHELPDPDNHDTVSLDDLFQLGGSNNEAN